MSAHSQLIAVKVFSYLFLSIKHNKNTCYAMLPLRESPCSPLIVPHPVQRRNRVYSSDVDLRCPQRPWYLHLHV